MDGTAQLLDIDRRYLVHPLHHPEEHKTPLFVVSAHGAMLRDADGREVIDGLSGLWNVNIGHGRGELADAAAEQMRKVAFASAYVGATNEPAIRLGEKIVKHAYANSSGVYFTTAGAESNEAAFKTARYYWKVKDKPNKIKIISRIHAYHGVTMAAMSATGMSAYHKMFGPLVPGFIQVAAPYAYRWQGNEEPGIGAAEAVEKAILAEGPDTVAAVIAEPVMGAGGVIVPPRTYWDKIQAVLRKYDILLVADEVICGFGRTGSFWGSETFGMKPDIVTMAKQLSAGFMPIAAVMMNQRVYEVLRENSNRNVSFAHGITYSGHPASAACALEVLKIYEEQKIIDRARDLAPHFLRQLHSFADHPLVGECRGVGLVGA
ncbi:MAG TPA: aspartate aminotransferase family protein, partial [Stellaceae bacterium]|nr:aspartate aminotransferase family protein [Stellaceae bacterium]